MRLDAAADMARRGRLYPSVILYGSSFEARRAKDRPWSSLCFCS